MYTIEDFRHAPMRVLGIADTAEEIPAVVKALGIDGHAFVSAARHESIEETFARADEHAQLVLDIEDANDTRDTVEVELALTEKELVRTKERLEEVSDEAETLRSRIRMLEDSAQPLLPQPAAQPAPSAKRARKKVA